MTEDEFDHFTDAQETVWANVVAELRGGNKRSHWMWFVFPVLEGVGQSPTALFYALRDVSEARDYMAHPIVGPRLLECAELLLTHPDKSAVDIFGETDAYKLHNSASLFALASPDAKPFHDILETFFNGTSAVRTRDILRERGDL